MQFQHTDLSELDELTEENLDFSALSDGLGFHNKQPRMNPPSKEIPVTASASAPMGASLAGTVRYSPALAAKPIIAAATAPLLTPKKIERAEKAPWLEPAANPFLRLGAFATDLFFVTMPLLIACKFSFTKSEFLSLLRNDSRSFLLLYAAILSVYFLLSESFGGQSLGKILWDLRIVEDDKYEKPIGFWLALFRLPALIMGILPLGLGLFSCFRDSKSRPWHDKATGSIVRRKN